jgi:hypothetical protein
MARLGEQARQKTRQRTLSDEDMFTDGGGKMNFLATSDQGSQVTLYVIHSISPPF